ncbi:MAG: sterol carrier family protein [Cellulomonadaceae bacterium]|jgi:hypothetical protein|nr:sterol carrier family protein [Cellulomonadaceae bacterium]
MPRRTPVAAGQAALNAWLASRQQTSSRGSDTPPRGSDTSPSSVAESPSGKAETSSSCESEPSPGEAKAVMTAVRYTLEELAARAPGNAVEIRVPPLGAVQALPGPAHRRGTPPAVVEMDGRTWLELATGLLAWEQACESGLVATSGLRADLGPWLPLFAN